MKKILILFMMLALFLSVAVAEEGTDMVEWGDYGRVQLTEVGKGASSLVTRKSVLASGPCSVSPVSLVVEDWRELWPAVEGLSVIQVHGSFVLLDAETGYRSQRRRLSGVVSLCE